MSETNNPWAWAGLLKWSLNYVDGTEDNDDFSPMSQEDKEFLEKVMKEGIVDEGDRMKVILTELTKAMVYYRALATNAGDAGDPPITEEALQDLLQELRDIVEQIDYARAFCSLQGLPFMMGCIQQPEVPNKTREICLGILSTLAQNNPPVQQQLLEIGAIKSLCDLFFSDEATNELQSKVMQSIGSIVRNHGVAENVFISLPQAPELMLRGLSSKEASNSLRSKTLFFLQALLTSDQADAIRIQTFQRAILMVTDSFLTGETPSGLREMAVAFLEKLLQDKKGGARIILSKKETLVALGVKQIASLRESRGEESNFAQVELEHWEQFLILLAKAKPERISI